ncbi:MAG: hypothetical protein NVSMB19_08760 [Vulcanimicrobiaceae bacterium]
MNGNVRTTVHLIRHGDALPDAATSARGSDGYDALGLSGKGVLQADALARRLARTRRIAAIYASPTRRAYETAAALAGPFGLAIVRDDRLREIALGDDALPATLAPEERANAIRERLAALAAIALRDGSWAAVPDVEAARDVRARIGAAVDDIVARHPGAHVAIVSHAGTINAYLAALLEPSRDVFFPLGNTSLSSVRVTAGQARIVRLNDTAHLERA